MLARDRGIRDVVILILLTSALPACDPRDLDRPGAPGPTEEPDEQVSQLTQDVRSFPCDSVSMTEIEIRGVSQGLAGEVQGNEVHDCQKLVLETGEFGSLVAAYPLRDALMSDSPSTFDSARVVATVFNWGDPYPSLELQPDWNCVWLQRQGSEEWAAVVTHSDRPCEGVATNLPNGTRLQVHRLTVDHTITYPVTARWGWSDADDVHYLGLKCGDGWCSLGPAGFTPRVTDLGAGGVEDVPGWYDEQHLAVPDGSGGLRPGPWGTIYPAPNLGQLKVANFADPQVVGYVTLDGSTEDVRHYIDAWNLHAHGRNTLRLVNRPQDSVAWHLQVRGPGNQEREFEVERLTGAMHAVSGAVRWRWDSDDERSWIGCDLACCTPKLSQF